MAARTKTLPVGLLIAAWLALCPAVASAQAQPKPEGPPPTTDKPPPAEPDPAPKPVHWVKPKPKLPPIPLKLTVTADSPDPPWMMRIENVGTTRVRIPADSRLLSFELRATKRWGVKKCSAPRAMVPTAFPEDRELFLEPGEFYEEQIDPRLYCFGDKVDLLRPGSKLVPKFGFGPSYAASPSEPFVAQETDRFTTYSSIKSVSGAELLLPPVPHHAPPPAPLPGASSGSTNPAAIAPPPPPAPPPAPAASAPLAAAGPASAAPDDEEEEQPPPPSPPKVDHGAGHFDIYLGRFEDASGARDVVVNIHAVNEGRRQLSAVVRGRMLHFRVEELGRDNRAIRAVDCVHQVAAHGIATEMVAKVRPGRKLDVPLLVAEICPRGTFPRPGLYRVLPTLDTSQVGESLKVDSWVGTALARQSALVRVGSAHDAYHFNPPRVGPWHLPAGLVLAHDPKGPAPKFGERPPVTIPPTPPKPAAPPAAPKPAPAAEPAHSPDA